MSFKLVCDHLKKLTPEELEKLKLILSGVVKSLPHDCVKGLYRIKHCPNINKCSKCRDK